MRAGGQKCPKICPHVLWMTPHRDFVKKIPTETGNIYFKIPTNIGIFRNSRYGFKVVSIQNYILMKFWCLLPLTKTTNSKYVCCYIGTHKFHSVRKNVVTKKNPNELVAKIYYTTATKNGRGFEKIMFEWRRATIDLSELGFGRYKSIVGKI